MREPDATSLPVFKAPPNACDCHLHIYGPKELYPEAPTSPFPIPNAPLSTYRVVMRRLGLARAVIVQPAGYADDNSCLVDTLEEMGESARGVAVIKPTVTDDELQRLTELGVRGIRFHMLAGGILPFDVLEEMAGRVNTFGWHVQLQMDGRHLPERFDMLNQLPGTLVIDHTGKFLEPVDTKHPGFRALLELVDAGNVWVKLSAPYETSKEGPPHYMDVGNLARALITHAPERMVWATNWPHPTMQDNPPDDAALLDVLRYWAESDEIANRILSDNPEKLYGF